jgi:hypothetical protein
MNNKYTTTDLYLSAFLRIKGFKFDIEKDGRKVIFSFEKTEDLSRSVIDYLNEEGQCAPLTYSNSIKNLKNLIYNL